MAYFARAVGSGENYFIFLENSRWGKTFAHFPGLIPGAHTIAQFPNPNTSLASPSEFAARSLVFSGNFPLSTRLVSFPGRRTVLPPKMQQSKRRIK